VPDISDNEILRFLQAVESGEVTLVSEGARSPQEIHSSNVAYKASNGWKIVVFNDANHWDYIDEIVTSDGRRVVYSDIAKSLPAVDNYKPSAEVSWSCYRIPGNAKFICDTCGLHLGKFAALEAHRPQCASGKLPKKISFRQIPWLPVLATGLALHNCYVPGGSTIAWWGLFLWFCFGCWHVLRFIRTRPVKFKPTSRRWVLLFLFCLALFPLSHLPVLWTFQSCATEFQAVADDLQKKSVHVKRQFLDKNMPVRARIGPYAIQDFGMQDDDSGVYFVTSSGGFMNTELHGFVLKPKSMTWYGHRTLHGNYHLFGDWYEFYQWEKW